MYHSVSRVALATALLSLTPAALAAAEDTTTNEEIVVTATRAEKGIPRAQLGSSVTIIQPQDLQLRQTRLVSDILRDVPGVAISRAGGVGGTTAVRLRGAESNHTLVLIDGMEVSDPIGGEFDFATLVADDVARLEVLRGQQSALYGSDAIAGIINYQTLSGADVPGISGRVEGGSFGTVDSTVRVAGVVDGFDYAVSGAYLTTDGTVTARGGNREVGAENATISGRFAYQVNAYLRLRAVGRYVNAEGDYNSTDYSFPPTSTFGMLVDGGGHYDNEAAYGLIAADLSLFDDAWTQSLTLQGVDARRRDTDFGLLSGSSEGSRLKASYVTAYTFGSGDLTHTITGAVDYKEETYQNTAPEPLTNAEQRLKRYSDNTGFVAQYNLDVGDSLGLGGAIRYDDNELFDSSTTYHLQASYRFDIGLRLHAAGGSGVKNPGYYELFGFDPNSFIGNPDLKPERSDGWEAGIEYGSTDGRMWIDVTYFDSTLEDEIYTSFTPTFSSMPLNRDTESRQKGVEVSGQALIGEAWRIFASYTYLDAEENGEEEVRRPPHSGSVNLSYVDPDGLFSGTLTVRYNGETYDNFFGLTTERVELPSYTLVNLGGDVRLNDQVRLYARAENLFDETYEEIFSYRSPGRAFYAGIRAGF